MRGSITITDHIYFISVRRRVAWAETLRQIESVFPYMIEVRPGLMGKRILFFLRIFPTLTAHVNFPRGEHKTGRSLQSSCSSSLSELSGEPTHCYRAQKEPNFKGWVTFVPGVGNPIFFHISGQDSGNEFFFATC